MSKEGNIKQGKTRQNKTRQKTKLNKTNKHKNTQSEQDKNKRDVTKCNTNNMKSWTLFTVILVDDKPIYTSRTTDSNRPVRVKYSRQLLCKHIPYFIC